MNGGHRVSARGRDFYQRALRLSSCLLGKLLGAWMDSLLEHFPPSVLMTTLQIEESTISDDRTAYLCTPQSYVKNRMNSSRRALPPPPPPPGAPPGGPNGLLSPSANLHEHSLRGGLPLDPSQWGFYSVFEHFEKGHLLDKKALKKFHDEYEELTKKKEEDSRRSLALREVLDHSKAEYHLRYNRLKSALEKTLLEVLPVVEHDADAEDNESPLKKVSRKSRYLEKAESFVPLIVSPAVASDLKLFESSTVWPETLVFTEKESSSRAFAVKIVTALRSRLAGFSDTQNTRVEFGSKVNIAKKLNEIFRRYLARRGAFYESTSYFYRGFRNYLNSAENPISDLPDESLLDDDTLRDFGVTYYLADQEVKKSNERLTTEVLARPVVTVPAIRTLKRAIEDAFTAESTRAKSKSRTALKSAFSSSNASKEPTVPADTVILLSILLSSDTVAAPDVEVAAEETEDEFTACPNDLTSDQRMNVDN
ncbi:hypothetical protein BC829DRAFT_421533 [Chytridium lagenaria]|nr:hypothetical protein BC829DRAFT_421533 [Chytridium lagenaria]